MVEKLTDDYLWERKQAYKEHVDGAKKKGKPPLTEQQFNRRWDKAHRAMGL